MAGFLHSLGIERAHLIGYSLGGGVVLHLAAKCPEMVRSIITIGTGETYGSSSNTSINKLLLRFYHHDILKIS